MKIGTIVLVIVGVAFFLAGCGGGATPKLTVKSGGKETPFEIKSSMSSYGNIISTEPGKPPVQTFSHSIFLANYEMDTTNEATMKKALTAPEQIRIAIGIDGEAGTKSDSPFKVGTYVLKTSERTNRVSLVTITVFADGKEKSESFDTMSSLSKAAGEVKITAVTDDSVSGELNVSEGDKSITGKFTAKLPKK